jgi:hypothetical protein
MATLLYMTARAPPAGAPVNSLFAGGDGGGFGGSYVSPYQATDGLQLTSEDPITSRLMTTNSSWAGARSTILKGSGGADMPIIPGGSGMGGYYYTQHWCSLGVFSIVLAGTQTISGNNIVTAGFGQVLQVTGWSGKISYSSNVLGPGKCGILPRSVYVWRPSTQMIVGDVITASDALHPWTETFIWGVKTADAYLNAGARFPNWHASFTYYNVDTLDGDLLCVEWWAGRSAGAGSGTYNAWDKQQYPNSEDGEVTYSTTYAMAVGLGSDPTLYSNQEGGGTSVNTLRSTQTIAFHEFGPRSPQTSISVSP